jgi:hypothetical protein
MAPPEVFVALGAGQFCAPEEANRQTIVGLPGLMPVAASAIAAPTVPSTATKDSENLRFIIYCDPCFV